MEERVINLIGTRAATRIVEIPEVGLEDKGTEQPPLSGTYDCHVIISQHDQETHCTLHVVDSEPAARSSPLRPSSAGHQMPQSPILLPRTPRRRRRGQDPSSPIHRIRIRYGHSQNWHGKLLLDPTVIGELSNRKQSRGEREIDKQDHRLTVRELEDELGIPKSSLRILTENLRMTRVCTKFIPKLLSDQHKNPRLEIAEDNLEMINSDENFLQKVIAGDKS
ncbi:unnamed protein product [Euphydryas editha]|uniref:Uncharacterized protein n=1 Tax=Euphydryas editha TaxID=104508 RepID=A0AAU9TT93_EUPED|nr:unnamed protein product [Euphydryas editha]